jgi:ketosteroid isomerase-like protein
MRSTFISLSLPALLATTVFAGSGPSDLETVARLDTSFQQAVKLNDAEAMARILDPRMMLVLGDGRVFTREQQIEEARQKLRSYEHQEEDPGTQTVRVWGDTAVVTARLWIKYTSQGQSFERRLWFSDTYARTPSGWRYVLGQASLPLSDPQ